ncbi:hypothetical protein [Belnapia moabensis]|uniref:hypothetical protein n=1 Tax=Belnapia moabensis TaxID=365533 RepID=UPI0005BC782C|nr:hypothetical protein [Belnapia moabensis]
MTVPCDTQIGSDLPRAAGLLLIGLGTAFIVYRSLYPFRFRPLADGVTLTEALLRGWRRRLRGRSDVAANLVLYALLGPAIAATAARRLSALLTMMLALLGCWLATWLYPFVPSIDLPEWGASLRPLLGGWGGIRGARCGSSCFGWPRGGWSRRLGKACSPACLWWPR